MKAWWVWLYCDVWLSRDMQWGLGSWISLPWYWLEISSDIPPTQRRRPPAEPPPCWPLGLSVCLGGAHIFISQHQDVLCPATRKYLSQKYHPSRKKITRLSKIFPVRRNPNFDFEQKYFCLRCSCSVVIFTLQYFRTVLPPTFPPNPHT